MDALNSMAKVVHERLVALIDNETPSLLTIRAILNTLRAASFITEESQFIQGSVTFSNPTQPDYFPHLQRASYPKFIELQKQEKFTPEFFVKIARAVDKWCGSIAIWGDKPSKLKVWGIIDQIVGMNKLLNREQQEGYFSRGLFTVIIERPGDLTVYHRDIFLGSLRSQKLLEREEEVFDSKEIISRLTPVFNCQSLAINSVIKKSIDCNYFEQHILNDLLNAWKNTIARICIGLRRMGTGGTLLISPNPNLKLLSISRCFSYGRLGSALTLGVLDEVYEHCLNELIKSPVPTVEFEELNRLKIELRKAEVDVRDRAYEITGAVKLVTSLAAMDGAILLNPDLSVIGFGVKIGEGIVPKKIFNGETFKTEDKHSKTIDISRFGTRHHSVLRYCNEDAEAIGLIISQDGHVRVVLNIDDKVVLWDKVQLLNHRNFSEESVRDAKEFRKRKGKRLMSEKYGYSQMPKSLSDLLAEKLNCS